MPTKAELEEENTRLKAELEFAHEVAAKLARDFRMVDDKLHAIEKLLKEGSG